MVLHSNVPSFLCCRLAAAIEANKSKARSLEYYVEQEHSVIQAFPQNTDRLQFLTGRWQAEQSPDGALPSARYTDHRTGQSAAA